MESSSPTQTCAIILAAGESSRLWPLSLDAPKGMQRVNGEIILERQIKQLLEAGITDICFITNASNYIGYSPLIKKYKCDAVLIHNEGAGNWKTLLRSQDWVGDRNVFVCSNDDWFFNNPFVNGQQSSWYGISFTQDPKEEWFIEADKPLSFGWEKKKSVGFFLFGCAFIVASHFQQACSTILRSDKGYSSLLWEDVFFQEGLFNFEKRELSGVEFDSLKEILAFDNSFLPRLSGGVTNSNYRWKDYIVRVPGNNAGARVNRKFEKEVEQAASSKGIDSLYVDMNIDGVKVSRFVDNCRHLNPYDMDEVKAAFKLLDGIGAEQLRSYRSFSLLEEAQKEIDGAVGAWRNELQEVWNKLDNNQPSLASIHYSERLSHNDFHSENILISKDRIDIIDWEFAGYGSWMNDYVSFLSCTKYTDEQVCQFLSLFHLTAEARQAVLWGAAVASLRWWAWSITENNPEWVQLCMDNTYQYMRLFGI